jgi:hypothetical protein
MEAHFSVVLVERLPVGRDRRGTPISAVVCRWTCVLAGCVGDRFYDAAPHKRFGSPIRPFESTQERCPAEGSMNFRETAYDSK